jgi:autotransporter-associated beta strand protein
MRRVLPNRCIATVIVWASMRRILLGAVFCLGVTAAYSQNATWLSTPGSTDFNTATNWSPASVPTGTATFSSSTITALTFSSPDTVIGSMQIVAGAPAYSYAVTSALEFNATGVVNNSSNAPTFNMSGGGGTFFENGSTAGNAIITTTGSGSFAEFANTSMAGSATITNSGGGGTFFVNTSTASSAAITNSGAGSFTEFSNTSTAGNATITNNGGTTFFNNSSTAAQATIVTNGGGILEFNNSSSAGNAIVITNAGGITAFQSTASGGQAQFRTNAGGSFDISGLSSTGLSVGSIAGAGTFDLGSKQLTVGSNNLSTVVSGQIADGGIFGGTGGSLVKIGAGTLTLLGNNTYTGATTIIAGTLEVDGAVASTSSLTVNAGGTLSGTGLVDPTTVTIMSSGTLAPGNASNPTGTLTIAGNLSFQSGAIYLVQVTPASAASTTVTGTASLAGTAQIMLAPGGYAKKSYDILHAAGGLGGTTFGSLILSNPNFGGSLSYTATDVLFNLTSASLGAGTTLNQNQQNVANAISNAFNSGATLPADFGGVFSLSGVALASALSQLDGEAATGAERAAFQLTNEFLALMLDPFVNGRGNVGGTSGPGLGFAPDEQTSLPPDVALAYASILNKAPPPSFEQRWTAWGSAFGGANKTNGDPAVGSNNTTASTYGFAGGMDYHFTPYTVAGFALAGAGTNWGLANALGTGRSDALQAGAYGISWFGAAYVAGALSFSNHWFTTGRSALGDQLSANFVGQSYGARLESGYRVAALPSFAVTPYGAVQFQDFNTPAYSEADLTGGGLGLTYASMNATDVRTELGSRFDAPTLVYGKPLVLYGRVAWAHDFVSNPALSAAFQALPGGSFTVNGAPIPHDSALTTAGAQLYLTPQWTLIAKFDGEFANGSQTYGGSGTLLYSW